MRILFSIETADTWILSAYKALFDALKEKTGYEVFCSVMGVSGSDQELLEYNFLDYQRISKTQNFKEYTSVVKNTYGAEFLKANAHWGNPNGMAERIALLKYSISLVQPDLVIVWNGLRDIRAIVHQIVNDAEIPHLFAEKGMLPESWCIDPEGINAGASICRSLWDHDLTEQQRAETLEYIESITNAGKSAWDQPERAANKADLLAHAGVGTGNKLIFFPGQVDKDSNITVFSSFADVAEAVEATLNSLPENTDILFKPHPKAEEQSLKKIQNLAATNPRLHIVENINIWDAIGFADTVVSINSSTAYEALLAHKKVVLLGESVLVKAGMLEKTEISSLRERLNQYTNASFDDIFRYEDVLKLTHFFKSAYYMYRDSAKVNEFQLACLQKAKSHTHLLSRNELLSVLYRYNNELVLQFDKSGNILPGSAQVNDNAAAMRCFEKAQKAFGAGDFVSAVELCKRYQSLINYDCLPRLTATKQLDEIDISVVVVTYKRTKDVRNALESLRRQDAGCKYEVIVVDNGQADTGEFAGLFEQYVCCPINFNLSEGRNIGVHFAKGKVIVFLDDDALVGPEYIGAIKAAFDEYEIIGLRGRAFPRSSQQANDHISIYNLGEKPFPTFCNQEGNSAFLRSVYLAVGGMDPLLFGHEGSDLTWRIMQAYGEMNRVIYWPAAVIRHDYGTGSKYNYKKRLHKRAASYLKYKFGTDIFADRKSIETLALVRRNWSGWDWKAAIRPKVSIVIACYNCEEFLPECIESIREQTLGEWELFLLDDNSKDSTRDLIRKYAQADSRIRAFYFDDNKGPYVRRNFAIEQARSEFILIQDADDIMIPHKLETFYCEINADQRLGIVGSFYRKFIERWQGDECAESCELMINNDEILSDFERSRYVTWHGSAIIRKSLFEKIGLFDKHPYGSDKFWLAKAGEYAMHTGAISIKNLPEHLTLKREHPLSQQGLLPPIDPKSRRAKFQAYWDEGLAAIREKARADSNVDIAELLKAMDCSDYISRFGHMFEEWENQPLDDLDLYRLLNRAIFELAEGRYVSCSITLDGLTRIVNGIERQYADFDYMRALAYFAINHDQYARKYIESEIINHASEHAKRFLSEHLDNATKSVSERAKIITAMIWTEQGALSEQFDINLKYPHLTLVNASCLYREDPNKIRSAYAYGSLLVKLGRLEEAAGPLARALNLLIIELGKVSVDGEDSEETLQECLTSTCTKLAKCYMHLRQFGKVKTVYTLLLSGKYGQLGFNEKAGIEKIMAAMTSVKAEAITMEPVEQAAVLKNDVARCACVRDSEMVRKSDVSIIMPAYNVQDYIAEAIGSVLGQSWKDFELVVIDDGSIDRTAEIVKSFADARIKYIYKPNGGLASARNAGIKAASGSIIMLLDSDDTMAAGFIEKHMCVFESRPEVDLVYCDDQMFSNDGQPGRVLKQLEYDNDNKLAHDLFCCGYPVIPFRTAMRKRVFEKIGFYDETLKIAEDYDMIRKFVRAGLKRHHLAEALYLRRTTPNSLSRSVSLEKSQCHFEVIARFLKTFTREQLFPDVNWANIEESRRQIMADCLVAAVYRSLAQNYLKSNVTLNSAIALECATASLRSCLQKDANFGPARQLWDVCVKDAADLQKIRCTA